MQEDKKIFNNSIGVKIKTKRLEMKKTQSWLANKLGVTFQQIQKYEKGTNGVSSSRLMQLANFLKVPITYFYEDFPNYKTENSIDANNSDLNYSFLVKTFSKLSDTDKTKLIQILRNSTSLKDTG